jgi:hypothetical protein
MENATQVARHLTTVKDIPISTQTVHHGLRSNGMKARTKQKRPYLKPICKRARMELAKKYKDWLVEDWKQVIWLDKTKINYFGLDGRTWVWKKPQKTLSDRLV